MITIKVKKLRTMAEKTVGLIGVNPVYPVYFTTRWGIHTFGVLTPIDVLILDKNNRVVCICKHLKPNRLFFWNPNFNRVLELPPGEIGKKSISIGNQIILKK
jgi:uncharacterized membrane protein (UPF0127 family)